ncbi:MAG: hypothetical protein ACR2Q3_17585 [Woeseiaceae bacterium]
MNLQRFQLLTFSLILTACNGGASTSDTPVPSSTQPLNIIPSNEAIIATVYDSAYSVPDGFFVDERANTLRSYSLYHVKDTSVSYELCSNDYSEAFAWEEADNISRPVSGYLVSSYENDKYFEFIRELSFPDDVGNTGNDTSPGFARVFKCSSIDRSGVDRNLRSGYGGTLNTRPLTSDVVRDFAEYLWQFTFFETSNRKVLDSYSTDNVNSYDHTLLLGFVINQGFGQCDRIEVVDWTFSADKLTGTVSRDFRFLFSLEAQLREGIPEQC